MRFILVIAVLAFSLFFVGCTGVAPNKQSTANTPAPQAQRPIQTYACPSGEVVTDVANCQPLKQIVIPALSSDKIIGCWRYSNLGQITQMDITGDGKFVMSGNLFIRGVWKHDSNNRYVISSPSLTEYIEYNPEFDSINDYATNGNPANGAMFYRC